MHAHLRGQAQLLTRLLQINTQLCQLGEVPFQLNEPIITTRQIENHRMNSHPNLRLNRNEDKARTVQTQSQVHSEPPEEVPELVHSQLRDPNANHS